MNTGKRLTQEEAVEKILLKCKEQNLEFIGFNNDTNTYTNNRVKLILKCKDCEYMWDTTSYDKLMSKNSRKCPKCSGHYHYTEEELIKQIKEICKKRNFKFLRFNEKGKHSLSSKIVLKCKKCGEEWNSTTVANFIREDRNSHHCGRKNPSSMPSNYVDKEILKQKILNKIEKSNLEFIDFKGEYKGRINCHVLLKCKICGIISEYRINAILYDNDIIKCKRCEVYGKRSNEEAINTIEEKCKILCYTFLGFNNSSNRYDGKKTRLILKCNKCGYIWKSTTYDVFVNTTITCRGCMNVWKMEKEVRYFLEKNQIRFEEQKKFPWLKNKIALSLDFYLPEHHIYIECQGRQHFEPVDKFGGELNFSETTERDEVKRKLCYNNGLKPIYYCLTKKYTEFKGEKVVKNEKELLEKIKEYGRKKEN